MLIGFRLVSVIVPMMSVLSACQGFPESQSSFPVPDAELKAITRHYDRHAREENNRCIHPEISNVTQVDVLDQDGARVSYGVRYYYIDYLYDNDDDVTIVGDRVFRPAFKLCRGFATREFVVETHDAGSPVVISMSEAKNRTR